MPSKFDYFVIGAIIAILFALASCASQDPQQVHIMTIGHDNAGWCDPVDYSDPAASACCCVMATRYEGGYPMPVLYHRDCSPSEVFECVNGNDETGIVPE